MQNGKRLWTLVLLAVFLLAAAGSFAGGQKEKGAAAAAGGPLARKLELKLASAEIEGDFMTVWAENFAKDMKDWSDDMVSIQVYPYGTLGDSRDVPELVQIGVVELAFSDYGWLSSFVPQAQVFALHYLWPREKMAETLEWVVKNGKVMGLLEQHFRRNGMVPLGIIYEGWQWVTSKTPKARLADYQGFKVRTMASKILVEDYKAYGASPTPMSYGDVYNGLQTGLIDGQVNPMFADYSMKFYEVQNHFTQLWAEPFVGIPTVNMQFFDGLPKEVQDKMRQWWADATVRSAKYIDERNDADQKKIQAERPDITFVELTDAETEPFRAQAVKVYPTFVQLGGEGAQQVLDTLIADIDQAKKALGIK